MTFEQNLTLGFAMAGVALVSSILSIAVTALVNHYLDNRKRKKEKRKTLFRLAGQRHAVDSKATQIKEIFGLGPNKEILETSLTEEEAIAMVEKFIEDEASDNRIDHMIGFLEEYNADMRNMAEEYFNLAREWALAKAPTNEEE